METFDVEFGEKPEPWCLPHSFRRHWGGSEDEERHCTAYGLCHNGACLKKEDDPIHTPPRIAFYDMSDAGTGGT